MVVRCVVGTQRYTWSMPKEHVGAQSRFAVSSLHFYDVIAALLSSLCL